MSLEEKEKYYVAVKVFLEQDGKLFIFKDTYSNWDLPGGRIKKDEFRTPLSSVVDRKMKEELGDDITYSIGNPLVFMRHERVEDAPGSPTIRIFAIGYPGKLESGEIKLGEIGAEMKWVDPNDFKPEDYFKGEWLEGVQEYLKVRE